MKTIILSIFFAISVTVAQGQSNIKLHSAELGIGGFSINNKLYEGGGASFVADITAAIDKNLLSVSYLTGTEIGIISSSAYSFYEYRIQYGRTLPVTYWLEFEGFAGLGYYDQQSDSNTVIDDRVISFPLKVNIKFYYNQHFGLGINTNYSINSINNNFTANLILHYRFN